jgi:hypothetical protein
MKALITLIEKRYQLKEGTKTAYKLTEETVREIDERQYNNIVNRDTQRFFRRLGGSETAESSYTCFGYKVTKLISKSSDRDMKVVREFQFIYKN